MNIFEHKSSFFGCLGSEIAEGSLLSLFRLAKQIKLRLGGKGYLLDNYLSLIFKVLSAESAYGAVDKSSDIGRFPQICLYSLLENTELQEHHPLENRIREIYARQIDGIAYQEPYTKLCLLYFTIEDELLEQAVEEFLMDLNHNLCGEVEEVRVMALYNEMTRLAGESLLEELNEKIRQRFLFAPLALLFAQGVNDDLLLRLTTRDDETSKQMFQLLLDSMPSGEEV